MPVEGLQPVWLEVVDEKVQARGEVRRVWKCLDVAAHQVHEDQHLDVVHEGHEKRKRCRL